MPCHDWLRLIVRMLIFWSLWVKEARGEHPRADISDPTHDGGPAVATLMPYDESRPDCDRSFSGSLPDRLFA